MPAKPAMKPLPTGMPRIAPDDVGKAGVKENDKRSDGSSRPFGMNVGDTAAERKQKLAAAKQKADEEAAAAAKIKADEEAAAAAKIKADEEAAAAAKIKADEEAAALLSKQKADEEAAALLSKQKADKEAAGEERAREETEDAVTTEENRQIEISRAKREAKVKEDALKRAERLKESEEREKKEAEWRKMANEDFDRQRAEKDAKMNETSASKEERVVQEIYNSIDSNPVSAADDINGRLNTDLMESQLSDADKASHVNEFGSKEVKDFSGVIGDGKHRRNFECPRPLMTDSYKVTHTLMYPKAEEMGAYGEFRESFPSIEDDRIVFYGMRYYLTQFILDKLTSGELGRANEFVRGFIKADGQQTKGHLTCNVEKKVPNPDGTGGFVTEIKSCFQLLSEAGCFPVKIEVLPEGSVVRPHIPVYKITASGENSRLVTFLETMLTMTWYPSTVATLSRQTKVLIENAFYKSVDGDGSVKKDVEDDSPEEKQLYKTLLDSALHDFGFRGCTCMEQSVIGGSAHLLSFTGSDTMSACYHVQYHLNGGIARGHSLAATEHSVMTSWATEIEALMNIMDNFPDATQISCVMDSYNYDLALEELLPIVRMKIPHGSKRVFVIRPDSGDAVTQVLAGLRAAQKHMGFVLNKKGFIVLKNCAVIQGDGINYKQVDLILREVLREGFAASNVAFGMGGGLLQKVNRDTLSFATKLSYIDKRIVMKAPAGQKSKWSLPGRISVLRKIISRGVDESSHVYSPHFVCTEEKGEELISQGDYVASMITVYDSGKTLPSTSPGAKYFEETFQDHINRMEKQWREAFGDSIFNAVHSSLKERQNLTADKIQAISVKTRTGSQLHVISRDLVWRLNRVIEAM